MAVYSVKHCKEIDVSDPEYVVHPNDEEPYIMGLKSAKLQTHYYLDGEEATKELFDWQEDTYTYGESGYQFIVKKLKDHQRVVDGEVCGSGNVKARFEKLER